MMQQEAFQCPLSLVTTLFIISDTQLGWGAIFTAACGSCKNHLEKTMNVYKHTATCMCEDHRVVLVDMSGVSATF